MRKPVVLITGAGGEIGHALVARLGQTEQRVITLDLNRLDSALRPSDTTIPFMVMPDACDALIGLARAPRERLTRTTYNVRGFSPSAAEIGAAVAAAFPEARITYKIDRKRQGIVDSWPADVDDSAAHTDWSFRPAYDFDRAFREYLIPTVSADYRS